MVDWRRTLALALLTALAACREPNPDFVGTTSGADDDGESATTVGSATTTVGTTTMTTTTTASTTTAGTTTDATETTAAPTTGEPAECTMDEPPAGGACPQECNGGCDGDVCTIDCSDGSCPGTTVQCPAEFACHIACEGAGVCSGATLQCPAEYACTISCNGGSACEQAEFVCGGGTCAVTCGSGSKVCRNAHMQCGSKNSDATCQAGTFIGFTPLDGSMCGCAGC